MRPGGGKSKGASWERLVCKKLSLWVSSGKSEDCFWRSAMSGGRATVKHRKGVSIRQAGDITAVSPEGHALTDRFFIECKHVRDLKVDSFLLNGTGPLAQFWRVCRKEARKHGRKPLIVCKQNNGPVMVISSINGLTTWCEPHLTSYARHCDITLLETLTGQAF